MKVINFKDELVLLTKMEVEVYKNLKESECLDDAYCSSADEISCQTEIKIEQLRGVISSLNKKGVTYVDELISGCGNWVILFETKA